MGGLGLRGITFGKELLGTELGWDPTELGKELGGRKGRLFAVRKGPKFCKEGWEDVREMSE